MELSRETRQNLRSAYPEDSDALFNAVWREVRSFARHSDIADLDGLYDTIVSNKVNNPRSRFYMFGK